MRDVPEMSTKNIGVQENAPIPMRDGTVLRADLYLPADREPSPTLVHRTVYNKSRSQTKEMHRRLAEAGYAVVVQDIRGRWASDGEFHPFFSEDWTDATDGYDTVEWAAVQPWSNGKVGTYGYSYSSWTQWALASTKPPHLVTMFTGGLGSRANDRTLGGSFRARQLIWILGDLAPDTQRVLEEPYGPTTVEGYEYLDQHVNREKWLWFLPLKDLPLEAVGGLRDRFRDWLASAHQDRWGIESNYGKIDLPISHRTGWYDQQVLTVELFRGMCEYGPTEQARENQRLIVGPWNHTYNLSRKTGEVDFGPEAEVDYHALLIHWFNYWLKGEQNGVMDGPPVRLFVMGANKWRSEWEWPLSRAQATEFYLHSGGNANTPYGDGYLNLQGPSEETSDGFTYDPRDPVMSLLPPNYHDEPRDHAVLAHRRDVLVYQTDPLEEPMEVTGYPVLSLYASSSAPDTDFVVRLLDVWPEGFAQTLCCGIVRARFRDSLDSPKLMTPGEIYKFTIRLLPTSNLFKPGHRIRVDITSSDFPNFDRNHNTGREDWADPELRIAHQTILHSTSCQSHITLPVISPA